MVFIPIIDNEHWFLIVCDLEMKTNYILNSLRPKDIRADTELAAEVVTNVFQILCRSKGYKHLVGVPLAKFSTLTVPQQQNLFDCGVHVLKWLEVGRNRGLWEDKSNFKALAGFRKDVALKLLRWQENNHKAY
ncbi:uncharacterized protein LOC141631226 [Silene latifolia]|uniref:uncharacterized protein LOC141631226 n=1 Tax=Silene latifolia TaxID=37657 RepID=UPI003D785EB8